MADPPQTVRMPVELRLVPSGAHLIELRDAARRALPGVPDEVVQDMLLVLDEAVANAIRYGSAAGQPVAVSIDCDGDWIDLAGVDQGPHPRLPSLPNEPPRRSPPGAAGSGSSSSSRTRSPWSARAPACGSPCAAGSGCPSAPASA